MIRILISIITIILFCISCSDDQENPDNAIYNCDELEDLITVFNNLEDSDDFIESYSIEQDYYQFNFRVMQSIKVELSCIANVFEKKDKSYLDIRFKNSQLVRVNFRNIVSLKYFHNPTGRTPLSGTLQVDAVLDGRLNFKIKNKKSGGKDYSFSFQEKSNNQLQPLLGLYYDNNNTIYVEYADDEIIYFKDTIYVQIGNRPNYFPNIIVDTYNESKVEPGMNLISNRVGDPSTPFIVDNEGEFRYVLDFRGDPELGNLNYDVGMERLKNGNYYFGKWLSNQVYEIDIMGNIIRQWDLGPYEFHHNIQEKEDGNFLVTVSKYDYHASGKTAIQDWIIELDRQSGAIVNEWDLKESLDENRKVWTWWIFNNLVDWAHVNAVIHDPSDNTIIVSCRTQCLVKLDQNNNVKWILSNHKNWGTNKKGEDLNQYLLNALDAGNNIIDDQKVQEGETLHDDFEWPWYHHAPFIAENGNLYVFDNGENRNFSASNSYSRAVEYEIDETNMTVKQIWQYGKERGIETYSRIVSDVDQLNQTGNILFSPGSRVNNGGGNFGAKVVEVEYNTREVVFEMKINGPDIVFHRAERLSLYPSKY
jgi:arylsulfate sulfotransferase